MVEPTKNAIRLARAALKMAEARHRAMNQALVEHDAKRAEILEHVRALDAAQTHAKVTLGQLTLSAPLRTVLLAAVHAGGEHRARRPQVERLRWLGLVELMPASREGRWFRITEAGRALVA